MSYCSYFTFFYISVHILHFCIFCHIVHILHSGKFLLVKHFDQDLFNPRDIGFNTFPTMSRNILRTMPPGEHGKINKAPIHEARHRAPCVLKVQKSNTNAGHIILYSTLLIGHTEHPGYMHISSFLFVEKTLRRSNRQDMVFIRLPGISEGAFELRMGNIWFCKLLFLFKIRSKTDFVL